MSGRASSGVTGGRIARCVPRATPSLWFTDVEIEQRPEAVVAALYDAMKGIPT